MNESAADAVIQFEEVTIQSAAASTFLPIRNWFDDYVGSFTGDKCMTKASLGKGPITIHKPAASNIAPQSPIAWI
jgi:hypothetical protein